MKVIAVAGTETGAGASVLAANLAAAAALAGNTVLLWPIDAGGRIGPGGLPNLSVVTGRTAPGWRAPGRAAKLSAEAARGHALTVRDVGLDGARGADADALIVAVPPGPNPATAFAEAATRAAGARAPLLPVLMALDRRLPGHRAAMLAQPDWPVIPRGLINPGAAVPGLFATHSPAAAAVWLLWDAVAPRLGLRR